MSSCQVFTNSRQGIEHANLQGSSFASFSLCFYESSILPIKAKLALILLTMNCHLYFQQFLQILFYCSRSWTEPNFAMSTLTRNQALTLRSLISCLHLSPRCQKYGLFAFYMKCFFIKFHSWAPLLPFLMGWRSLRWHKLHEPIRGYFR